MTGQKFFFLFALILLTQCAQKEGGGNGDLSSGGGYGLDDSGNFDSSGNVNPTAGYDELSDSLGQLPTNSAAEQNAVASAQDALGSASSAYNSLSEGMTGADIQKFIEGVERFRQKSNEAAALLAQAGFAQLAELFRKMAQKVDILRLFHTGAQKHTYIVGSREGFALSQTLGYKFQGIAFRVYKNNQLDPGCRLPIFTCQNGTDNFTSNDPKCEGKRVVRQLGFVCTSPGNGHPIPLSRIAEVGKDHRLTTLNQEEVKKKVATKKWKFERYQGFPVF